MKHLILLILFFISLKCISFEVLYPSFDSDIYHYTNSETSTYFTLGVSGGSGSGTHYQTSILEFNTNLIFPAIYASLELYVTPKPTAGHGSGFSAGSLSLSEQGQQRVGGFNPFYNRTQDFIKSDISGGDLIAEFSVLEESQWISLDVTNTLNKWVENPNSNYGFLLHSAGDNPDTVDFNESTGSVSTQFASSYTGTINTNDPLTISALVELLQSINYQESNGAFEVNNYRINTNSVDFYPNYLNNPVRLEISQNKLIGISVFNSATGNTIESLASIEIGPSTQPILKIFYSNLNLSITSKDNFNHATLDNSFEVSYQWSKDLINWNNDGESFDNNTVSFTESIDSEGSITYVTTEIIGHELKNLYYRAQIN